MVSSFRFWQFLFQMSVSELPIPLDVGDEKLAKMNSRKVVPLPFHNTWNYIWESKNRLLLNIHFQKLNISINNIKY